MASFVSFLAVKEPNSFGLVLFLKKNLDQNSHTRYLKLWPSLLLMMSKSSGDISKITIFDDHESLTQNPLIFNFLPFL